MNKPIKKIKKTMEEKMKTIRNYGLMVFALFMAIAIGMPQAAHAVGTAATTKIINQASLDYSVGGASASTLYSCNSVVGACTTTVAGGGVNETSFLVDEKINFTVTAVDVTPKTVFTNTTAVFTYLVTNTGNSTVRFNLAAVTDDSANDILSDSGQTIYRDTDASGTLNAGDTPYVNAGSFPDIIAGGTLQVLVVGAVRATATNGQTATITSLTAQAAHNIAYGNSNVILEADSVGTGLGTAFVFADAGAVNYDNSVAVADQVWVIAAPVLTLEKTENLIADGLGGAEGYIPGATVEYTIVATYASGSGTAAGVTITENIPANMTAISGFYTGGDVEWNGAGITNGAVLSGWGTATFAVICGDMVITDTCTVIFRGTIN